jgi:hypothetical protein
MKRAESFEIQVLPSLRDRPAYGAFDSNELHRGG